MSTYLNDRKTTHQREQPRLKFPSVYISVQGRCQARNHRLISRAAASGVSNTGTL